MQFDFRFDPERPVSPDEKWVPVGAQRVQYHFVRHRRARRYVLRLRPDGSARVTIPRGGSAAEARRFAGRKKDWVLSGMPRLPPLPRPPKGWVVGTAVFFPGKLMENEGAGHGGSKLNTCWPL